MHCEGGVYIATTNHFCFLRSISTSTIWMSLGQSRIDIIADGIYPFTYASRSITFPIWSPEPGRLNCVVGKELASFVLLIARKSSCAHTNPDKASSLFLTELMLIYDRQTFSDVLVESLLNCFLSSQY